LLCCFIIFSRNAVSIYFANSSTAADKNKAVARPLNGCVNGCANGYANGYANDCHSSAAKSTSSMEHGEQQPTALMTPAPALNTRSAVSCSSSIDHSKGAAAAAHYQ
jgi:hypothetical protein